MYTIPASTPVPLRPFLSRQDIYRAHLSDIRHYYQTLLASLTDSDWRLPCVTTKWTVGELMVHLYLRLASIPSALNGIRMGKGYLTMPYFMREYIQFWHVKTHAGKWTPTRLGVAYDEAYHRTVEALAKVGDEEWWLTAEVWGEREMTIEALFEGYPDYYATHLYDIRVAIGR